MIHLVLGGRVVVRVDLLNSVLPSTLPSVTHAFMLQPQRR